MSVVNFGTLPNITTATHTVITVVNTTTTVLSPNDNRTYVLLVNDSDEAIYIKLGAAAVLNDGIRINANGGSYTLNPANANLFLVLETFNKCPFYFISPVIPLIKSIISSSSQYTCL